MNRRVASTGASPLFCLSVSCQVPGTGNRVRLRRTAAENGNEDGELGGSSLLPSLHLLLSAKISLIALTVFELVKVCVCVNVCVFGGTPTVGISL